jgi:hypothetical protein
MIMRALTSAGDWTFGKGLSNYNTDENAINEDIQTWLQSWVSNCFFALKDGIDWTNLLGVGQQTNLKNALRQGILQRTGVIGINSMDFEFNPQTRAVTINFDVTTIYSQSFQNTITVTAGVPLGN